MDKDLKKFIFIDSIAYAILFGLVGGWFFNGSGSERLGALAVLVLYSFVQGWLVFEISGISVKNKKRWGLAYPSDLDHKSYETLNRYWLVDGIAFYAVGAAYVAIFQRSNWRQNIGLAAFLIAFMLLKQHEDRRRIKGIRKKELFQ